MRTTFSRLFSVTALIVLVAVVGLGMSFRVMVKNYLAAEQQEALQAKAATVTELTADYAGFASAYGLDVSTKFHKTLSFASQFSQTDILVCDTQGRSSPAPARSSGAGTSACTWTRITCRRCSSMEKTPAPGS